MKLLVAKCILSWVLMLGARRCGCETASMLVGREETKKGVAMSALWKASFYYK